MNKKEGDPKSLPQESVENVRIDTRSRNYPEFKIEKVIPLETRNDAFLGEFAFVKYNGKYIVVSDEKKIVIFNNDGSIHKVLEIQGRGVGESLYLQDFYIDDKYIYINTHQKGVVKYDFDGKYITTYTLDDFIGSFVVSADKIYAEIAQTRGSENKKIGIVNIKNGRTEKRLIDHFKFLSSEGGYDVLAKNGGDVFYMPCFTDTIFLLQGMAYKPILTYDFGKIRATREDMENIMRKSNDPSTWQKYLYTNELVSYLKIAFTGKWLNFNYSRRDKKYAFFYNISTKQQFLSEVTDNLPYPLGEVVKYVYDGKFIVMSDADNFISRYSCPEKTGVKEEDNPVIVIYSLK